jgi:hypothetical protein
MNTITDWSFECQPSGRDGYFFYHEGPREIPFYWEYGGGDVIVIVRFDEPDKFALRCPWATERKREILERVAQELIRQGAPGYRAEIDERNICIYVRQKPAA